MSVPSINSASTQTYQPTSGDASSRSGTSGAAANSGSTAASTSANTSGSSSIVTLSPGAQALAEAAADGITVEQINLAGAGMSAGPAQQLALLQKLTRASLAGGSLQNPNASISQSAFENLVAQLGGSKQQADEVFQGFDTNGDGSISNAEFEQGLANALKNQDSPFAQALFGLMDTNGSPTVSALQFSQFEAAFLKAEN